MPRLQRREHFLRQLLRLIRIHRAERLRHPALQPECVPSYLLHIQRRATAAILRCAVRPDIDTGGAGRRCLLPSLYSTVV